MGYWHCKQGKLKGFSFILYYQVVKKKKKKIIQNKDEIAKLRQECIIPAHGFCIQFED